jgi:hypothetical protein
MIWMNLRTSRGRKPPGSGQPVPGHERRVEAVDVEGQPDRLGAVPGHLERPLGGLLDAHLDAVGDGHDRGAALPADLDAGPGRLPAADADLHQVLRRHVGDVRGVEPGVVCIRSSRSVSWVSTCRSKWMMPRLPCRCWATPRTVGIADGVVAAEHDRERAGLVDVPDGLGDLVERLLDVRRDGEDVARGRDGDRLAQVDAELERCTARRARRSCGCPAGRSGCRTGRWCRRRTARRARRRRTRRSAARPRRTAP